jgi:hypothetical protein
MTDSDRTSIPLEGAVKTIMGALEPIVLDENALFAAAGCAEDVFDVPEARHIEVARRYVTTYLRTLGASAPPPPPPAPLRRPGEITWP